MTKKSQQISVVALALVFMLICSQFVYANGGPLVEEPNGEGKLSFMEDSSIQLESESIDIQLADAGYHLNGMVEVVYHLVAGEAETSEVYFVVQESQEYEVLLDGVDITVSTNYIEDTELTNWVSLYQGDIIDPISGDILKHDFDDEYRRYESQGITIPLDFQKNQKRELIIRYETIGGFDDSNDLENSVYSFVYFLTPARFWQGEPNVDILIRLDDKDKFKMHSNLSLQEVSDSEYTLHLEVLPEEELVISLVSTKGLYFGTNDMGKHNRYVLLISLVIFLFGVILAIIIKKNFPYIISYILSQLAFIVLIGDLGHDYITVMAYTLIIVFFWIGVPIVYIIIYFIARYIKKKKNK